MQDRPANLSYEEWIARERRIRLRILQSSPEIRATGNYRVCGQCREICLCHETVCPNCNQSAIVAEHLPGRGDEEITRRIRCVYRFQHLD